jgi:phosphoserine aminotransferase
MLPLPVLQQIQDELLCFGETGESVMEMSHRSKPFVAIFEDAVRRLKSLLQIGEDFEILMLQGGGRLQNLMIPMNLAVAGKPADYVVTGAWGLYSFKDAQKLTSARVAWDGESGGFRHVPGADEWTLDPHAAYVHITSNETIQGVQFAEYPETGDVPLVIDASSDFLSRPIDFGRADLVYACAQKNAGISGLTVVVMRRSLLEQTRGRAPGYLNYAAHADAEGMYNTPPTFAVYVTGLVCRWIEDTFGSLSGIAAENRAKANMVYDALEASQGFYRIHARPDSRSEMNVCFTTPSPELDEQFCKGAAAHLLSDLKGHRSVGGVRASIYNAMPREGVSTLVQYIEEFAATHRRNG